jgi:hypothetical protein
VASEVAGIPGQVGTSGNAAWDTWVLNNSSEPVKLLQ